MSNEVSSGNSTCISAAAERENQEAAKEKERLRWHTRREQHKVRVVADLTARERRSVRKKWRETKAEYRKKTAKDT